MIFPSRNQLASKQITRTGRAEAVTKESLAATLLQHVSPIEWDHVILYGQYVLDRARGPLRNGSLCCISTRMWALPLLVKTCPVLHIHLHP